MKNEKKKILILGFYPHDALGGIEYYNYLLLKYLPKNKYDVFEYASIDHEEDKWRIVRENAILDDSKIITKIHKDTIFKFNWNKLDGEKNNFKKQIRFYKNTIFITRKVKKLDKIYNFDWIIDCVGIPYNKQKKIFVQHISPAILQNKNNKNKFINFFNNLIFKIIRKDFLVQSKNVVLFDKENEKAINKPNKKYFKIPNCYEYKIKTIEEINLSKRNDILFSGRFNEDQKRISLLSQMAPKLSLKINAYGAGPDEYLLNGVDNLSIMGKYNSNQLENIMSNHKFFIMTSNFEGFPFVLVEALANGLPIIILDTYPSAKFLINEGKNGLLLDSNLSVEELTKKINNFINMDENIYKEYVENCLKFAEEKLSLKNFIQSWMNILDSK